MNWTDKSNEIAESIISTIDENTDITKVLPALLATAARKGMEFECDNWVLRRR